jgi:hypothetical protein
MRPPISLPTGEIIREEKPEFDAKERSISYQINTLSYCRLQIKSTVSNPYSYIFVVIVSIILAVIIFPINIRPLRGFSLWQSFSLITLGAFLGMVLSTSLILPLITFFQMIFRGREETTLINEEGVYNTADKFPIAINWKRIKRITTWSGDVLIMNFGGGVLVPRHAFCTSQEAEDFAYAARQFHRLSRESKRLSK